MEDLRLRIARISLGASLGWVLLVFASVAGSVFQVSEGPATLWQYLARGAGFLVIAALALVLHLLALWATWRGAPRTRKLFTALAALGMALIAFVTGFTIGGFLLPAVGLLLVAAVLLALG